jgi:HNH endonuclease
MNAVAQNKCIFCLRSDRTFTKETHIIPESAGNERLLLPKGYECDQCNEGFSVIEQQVLRSFPGQFFRVAFVDKTKRGLPPTSDIKGGKLKRVQSPERPTVQIRQYSQNPYAGKHTSEQDRIEITWEAQHFSAPKVSAFLAKISLEYFCLQAADVYSAEYDNLRCGAKSYGSSPFIPFFIGVHAEPTQAVELLSANKEILEASRPVWVRFPGFSAVIPTSKTLQNSALERLQSFILGEMSGQFLLISDPNWEKPIKVELTSIPCSQVAAEEVRAIARAKFGLP